MTDGRVNPARRLENQGITGMGHVHYNYLEPALVEAAVARDEGHLGRGGALLVTTGQFTGRSPKDKFVVRTPSVENTIWWDNNASMSPLGFDALHSDLLTHMKGRDFFVQDLYAGADPIHLIDEYELLRREIRQCEFIVYENLPHNITDTVPDRCAQELLRFLKSVA